MACVKSGFVSLIILTCLQAGQCCSDLQSFMLNTINRVVFKGLACDLPVPWLQRLRLQNIQGAKYFTSDFGGCLNPDPSTLDLKPEKNANVAASLITNIKIVASLCNDSILYFKWINMRSILI